MPRKKTEKKGDLHVRAENVLLQAIKEAAVAEDRTPTLLVNKILREYLIKHHGYKDPKKE